MLPTVSILKTDGNTGVVRPSPDGILAIIAPCASGTENQPSSFSRLDLAVAAFGYGILTDAAGYDLTVARRPVVLIRGTASTAGSLGSVSHEGEGTSEVTVSGTPLDDYEAEITILTAGTIGAEGITLKYSLDGGVTYSAAVALGTDDEFTIPDSGVTFEFGDGTVLAGQKESVSATGPRMTNANLVTALEALRTFGGQWDAVLVCGLDATATELSTLDLWLAAREAEGKHRTGIVNAAPRNPSTQTEAQYATAMTTAWGSSSSPRVVVCADAGDLVSVVRGIRQRRPISIGVAARGMLIDISTDAAFVADGPIPGYQIADERGNPKYHDEALFPGLDDLRLTTLRSFPGRAGAFITNANLLSASGSDYVYWQHARVMNRACEIAYQVLTTRLSQGVRKDVATGFILEEDALEIEGLVNAELDRQLVTPQRVSGARFTLARTDDLSSNAGAVLNGDVEISALAYVKRFDVKSKFVKTISVSAAA